MQTVDTGGLKCKSECFGPRDFLSVSSVHLCSTCICYFALDDLLVLSITLKHVAFAWIDDGLLNKRH